MRIEELVLHPAQLVNVDLVSLECKKYEDYNVRNKEVKISVKVDTADIQEMTGKVVIEMLLKGEGFSLSVIQKGSFEFDFKKENTVLKRFLETQGVKLMWPYFREVIYEVSGRMLDRPISVPTIDVLATVKKATEIEE